MNVNWMAQAVGIIGVAAFILSFQIKSNKKLLAAQIFADFMFCVQFILLTAYSGCANLLVLIVRCVIIMLKPDHKWARWNGWLVIFVAGSAAATAFTWTGPVCLLPLVASIGTTVAYWSENARAFRTSNLFCACPCWLTYDLIVGAYAGVLNETIAATSIIVSIIRFGWKSLGENEFKTHGTEAARKLTGTSLRGEE